MGSGVGRGVGRDVGRVGRDVGREGRDVGRDVGREGRDVGRDGRDVGRDVGRGRFGQGGALKCLAELEVAESRVFVRLSFASEGLKLLTAGAILLYPQHWDALRDILEANTELEVIPVNKFDKFYADAAERGKYAEEEGADDIDAEDEEA